MILGNREIRKALTGGNIIISPPPIEPFDSTAVDLRLGDSILLPKKGLSLSFDLRQKGIATTLKQFYENHPISPAGGFVLQPLQFAIANTLECIQLPIRANTPCYAARVEGKSSLARCGLIIHFTAPTIHAGFNGTITLELMNLGSYPINLYQSMSICQLIFERVEGEIDFSPSQFQGQKTPEGS